MTKTLSSMIGAMLLAALSLCSCTRYDSLVGQSYPVILDSGETADLYGGLVPFQCGIVITFGAGCKCSATHVDATHGVYDESRIASEVLGEYTHTDDKIAFKGLKLDLKVSYTDYPALHFAEDRTIEILSATIKGSALEVVYSTTP